MSESIAEKEIKNDYSADSIQVLEGLEAVRFQLCKMPTSKTEIWDYLYDWNNV